MVSWGGGTRTLLRHNELYCGERDTTVRLIISVPRSLTPRAARRDHGEGQNDPRVR